MINIDNIINIWLLDIKLMIIHLGKNPNSGGSPAKLNIIVIVIIKGVNVMYIILLSKLECILLVLIIIIISLVVIII